MAKRKYKFSKSTIDYYNIESKQENKNPIYAIYIIPSSR